jgi:hypothetical protein
MMARHHDVVQRTAGILRVFQVVFWLRVFSSILPSPSWRFLSIAA